MAETYRNQKGSCEESLTDEVGGAGNECSENGCVLAEG